MTKTRSSVKQCLFCSYVVDSVSIKSTPPVVSFKAKELSKWKLPKVTSLKSMFYDVKFFEENLSTWDVSNITTMKWAFGGTKVRGVSKWKMPKVTNMAGMFYMWAADEDLSEWSGNMLKVTSMTYMFYNSKSFTGKGLSKWDVSNVTHMGNMFRGTNVFNADITKWNVSKVTDMSEMFYQVKVFSQDLSNWDVSKVTTMSHMFNGATEFYRVLCGDAWVKAKENNAVNKKNMFSNSPADSRGGISETCGVCLIDIV